MARFGVVETPIAVGDTLAYTFHVNGNADWFGGEVLRLSKPHWEDVDFADGKLWMRSKMQQRGITWVKLQPL
jgi:hypothetical protein